jgi:hypothetical protein
VGFLQPPGPRLPVCSSSSCRARGARSSGGGLRSRRRAQGGGPQRAALARAGHRSAQAGPAEVIERGRASASLVSTSHRYCAYLVSSYAPSHPSWSLIPSNTTCASLSTQTTQTTQITQTPQAMPYSLNLPKQKQASDQRNPIPVPFESMYSLPFPFPLEVDHSKSNTV